MNRTDNADDIREIKTEPIDGEILQTWFADFRTLIAEVRDDEGNTWREEYTFERATTDVNTPEAPDGWETSTGGRHLKEYYHDEREVSVAIQEYEDGGDWHVTIHEPNEQRGGIMGLVDAWTFEAADEAAGKVTEILQETRD